LLARDYKGKEADRLLTRIAPGMVSLFAELRGHERQAAEDLGQWKTRVEEPKVIDASPAVVTLAMLFTWRSQVDLERRALEPEKALESSA
jgi:hypothetical protein